MSENLSPERIAQLEHLMDTLGQLPVEEWEATLLQTALDDPHLHRDLALIVSSESAQSRFTEELSRELDTTLSRLTEARGAISSSWDLTGKRVSRYLIEKPLGRGGMGVVYEALDPSLGRRVALKFLPPELSRDEEAKARFIQEAKAASALDHPNICTIHEIGEASVDDDPGQPQLLFIAMARYGGETLRERMRRDPMSIEEILAVGIQIAEGLERAHAAGIVHRDIKPANVILSEEGPVKIVDFGLAKISGGELTRTGITMGTVAYMSPEQLRGEDVDHRTDLWALGVVLYEMAAGRRPFRGDRTESVIYSILHENPEAVETIGQPLNREFREIIRRSLHKDPGRRYATTTEMLEDLRDLQSTLSGGERIRLSPGILVRKLRRPAVAIPMLMSLTVLALAVTWIMERRANVRWAREEALPRIEEMVESSWRDYTAAYALAEEARRYIPDDPTLLNLIERASVWISIESDPAGAEVSYKEYAKPESDWIVLGTTPLEKVRVPVGIFRWKMEKPGFGPVFAAASSWDVSLGETLLVGSDLRRTLDPEGSIPAGMVRVGGAETPIGKIEDFLIDRFEVTNAMYREFVDAGGYQRPEYWRHPFVREGVQVSWEEAMAELVDGTGRPGPSTWEGGSYPAGTGNHPVGGVSWYEAAAYAEFAGKALPTGTHWGIARGEYTPLIRWPQLGGYATFAPFSNFGGSGPVEAGSLPGWTAWGAYDMAGNVREWCLNETPQGRLVRGGAWDDNTYRFTQLAQLPAWDRSARNGFRCAVVPGEEIPGEAYAKVEFEEPPDLSKVEPVAPEVFEAYLTQFEYDPRPLDAEVERREVTQDFVHERISVDTAYGDGEDRLILHLFIPRRAEPPFQTVVYFPGSASLFQQSSEEITSYYEFPVFLSFLLGNGRAVLYPVYDGTFERSDPEAARVHQGEQSHLFTDYVIRWVKDFKRSVDYLETRKEIDASRIAFYGMSWGGAIGPIISAVEERVEAAILAPGMLLRPARPEADLTTYLPYVRTPTLMLNGRYDTIAGPTIEPLYELLGTPEEHKVLKVYDTDHIPPRSEYIREILGWLDEYLGPVGRHVTSETRSSAEAVTRISSRQEPRHLEGLCS